MKICASCGHSNTDESVFCVSCGTELVNAKQNDRIHLDFSKSGGFVSEDEYVVATLSNDMATNFVSGEGLKTEDAVLTNKRLYYNHKTGILNIRVQEEKVNVKDITGSKIADLNPVGILVLSILVAIIGVIVALAEEEFGIFVVFVFAALIVFVAYQIVKKAHLKIEYAGGSIYFSVKKYGKENIQRFQKSIYAVKDHIENNQNK